jgi:hypothetical protein
MKKHYGIKSTLFFLLFFVTMFSCKESTELVSLQEDSFFSKTRLGTNTPLFNNDQYGDFVYHHLKYYASTVNYEDFMPEDFMTAFNQVFSRLRQRYDAEGWDNRTAVAYLVEQEYYSEQQAAVYLAHIDEMLEYIESHPDAAQFVRWANEKNTQIIENGELPYTQKSKVLNEITIIQAALRYKLETMPESAKGLKAGRIAAGCDFWEALRCWLGHVGGLSGIAGTASDIAAGITDLSSGFSVIGAIIGVVVGTVQAIQSCTCDYNVCDPPKGVAFPYACYTRGDPLLFTAWGYGSITPSFFEWQFYKNNDLSSSSNFYGNQTSTNYIYLPGSEVVNDGVYEVAVKVSSYCTNQWEPSPYFGWYHLDELGKPYFSISGPGSITTADADYTVTGFSYFATGPVQNTPSTSVQWEILPGYPGYTATGTILYGTYSKELRVRWDDTPGYAILKCTATSPCATVVNYYNVHIYQ